MTATQWRIAYRLQRLTVSADGRYWQPPTPSLNQTRCGGG